MYAVIKYNDYSKEQFFEVIMTTHDLNYAKKVAFHSAKEDLPKDTNEYNYKITTEIEIKYFQSNNKLITDYRIVELKEYEDGYKLMSLYSRVYAVIELDKYNKDIDEIDNNLICNDYNAYYEYDSYCNYQET